MFGVYQNTRKIACYLSLDSQKKKILAKHFCYSLLKMKNYPELENEEILMQINKLELSKISEVLEGKFYRNNYMTVFGEINSNNLIDNTEAKEVDGMLENKYNPLSQLEKSRDIEEIQYEQMNVFKYFSHFNNFIEAFVKMNSGLNSKLEKSENFKNKENEENSEEFVTENEKIDTFIKSLCKLYVGHTIHQRINNEISKKTNIYILKGDYFFSLGYYSVSQIGNPLLIRFYSKISENFSRSVFYLKNLVTLKANANSNFKNSSPSEIQYLSHLIKKYVSFIYYGCCGIKELHQNFFLDQNYDIVKEFSFKYGLLLYLREELAFLKNKTFEYYSNIDDLISSLLLYNEKNISLKGDNSNSEDFEEIQRKIKDLTQNKSYVDKYKFFAVNICSELLEIIENLKKQILENNKDGLKNIEEMKAYLKVICLDVENLAKI